jgi:predicted ATP-dependent serine protease
MANYKCKECKHTFHIKVKKGAIYKCTLCASENVKYIGSCGECMEYIEIDAMTGTCRRFIKVNKNNLKYECFV